MEKDYVGIVMIVLVLMFMGFLAGVFVGIHSERENPKFTLSDYSYASMSCSNGLKVKVGHGLDPQIKELVQISKRICPKKD
jgi:pyridoxine 5'-phosphate synthase PdxJ